MRVLLQTIAYPLRVIKYPPTVSALTASTLRNDHPGWDLLADAKPSIQLDMRQQSMVPLRKCHEVEEQINPAQLRDCPSHGMATLSDIVRVLRQLFQNEASDKQSEQTPSTKLLVKPSSFISFRYTGSSCFHDVVHVEDK